MVCCVIAFQCDFDMSLPSTIIPIKNSPPPVLAVAKWNCIQVKQENTIAAEKQAAVEKQRALDMTRAGRFGAGDVGSGDPATDATYPIASPQRKTGPPPLRSISGRPAGDLQETGAAAGAGLVGDHAVSTTVRGWGARGVLTFGICVPEIRGIIFSARAKGFVLKTVHAVFDDR